MVDKHGKKHVHFNPTALRMAKTPSKFCLSEALLNIPHVAILFLLKHQNSSEG